MYTQAIQYSFPQENLTDSKDNPKPVLSPKKNILKNRNIANADNRNKSKNRLSFATKLKAILKPQASSRVSKATRIAAGKKVTWNLDEEQVQPGESILSQSDAWPSPESDENRLFSTLSMDAGSYVMSPGDDDEITTPTHVHHERQQNLFEPIIPIHTRTLNPLRAASAYHSKVSHKRSSSFPNDEGVPETSESTDHKRFSSLDDIEPKINYENHQQAPWYKQANVDWTQNRIKPSGTKPVRIGKEFLNSWSGKNQNESIFDDLSQFLDSNTDSVAANKRITIPVADDQVSIIESEASSIHTWFEHDDRTEDEPRPFLYEQSTHLIPSTRRPQPNPLSSSVKIILPPIHPQPSRKWQENYIVLPLQSYSTSTVCEVTFSSQITLLASNSLTEITFDTNDTPPFIIKTHSPTICEMSDRQCPPFYINASSSLPHLNCSSRTNPCMSYRQIHTEGKNTVPRTKRSYRSPYQHVVPEDSNWPRQVPLQTTDRVSITPSSGSDPYLDCDKSTGQMISPSLRRLPFKRGYLDRNNSSLRSATSFSHLYTNCSNNQVRSVGSLKCSYSASCVRDPSPYVCYTAHDPTPAYIPQETQSPYNMDQLMNQYCMVEDAADTNIGYRAPPRYFTPHPLGICCECNEYIYPAPCQPVRIKNRIFHPDCFKCADCYSLLHILSYHETQGKFYCPRDFKRHVICHLCKQPLASYRGRESPVNIYDKFFHPQCYRCTSCSTQSQKLSFDGRWLLCLPCSQARRNQTIKPTHLTPRKTLVTLL